jgi:Cro/C1-type HTH DNA-binding domain
MTNTLKLNDILTNLMSNNSIDDALLSKETGIPISTIKRMRLNEDANPTGTTLAPIASYFKITIDQLLGLSPLDQVTSTPKQLRIVPVLTKDTIQPWLKNELDNDIITEWTKTSLDDSKCYAIRCCSFTTSKKFHNQSIMIISPSMNPVAGDLIVISNQKFKYPTLLELHKTEEQYFVTLIDKSNDLIHLKLPFIFYGVVSEVFYHTKIENESNIISEGMVLAPFMLKCK